MPSSIGHKGTQTLESSPSQKFLFTKVSQFSCVLSTLRGRVSQKVFPYILTSIPCPSIIHHCCRTWKPAITLSAVATAVVCFYNNIRNQVTNSGCVKMLGLEDEDWYLIACIILLILLVILEILVDA